LCRASSFDFKITVVSSNTVIGDAESDSHLCRHADVCFVRVIVLKVSLCICDVLAVLREELGGGKCSEAERFRG
jgi:hypothetical protein